MSEKELNSKSETAKREEEVLVFWREHKTFEKSLEKKAPKGEFVFYDGPPFATGLPHAGSLLSSIIKDVIPRYKTMRGYHVRRRWGWDTHGLPIENLVEKELGLKSKKEILDIGIDVFNEKARSVVLRYVADWKSYIERVGRWVDYDNSYKTMDNSYIESVWWALKKLWEKKLLYEGRKVLMYCPHCETPLAKAEIAADNTYKDITEEAVTVRFKIRHPQQHGLPDNTSFLAWTTTPWTLPGNVALAVHPDMSYVLAPTDKGMVIIAKDRLEILKSSERPAVMVDTGKEMKGSELVGIAYESLYDVSSVVKHEGKRYVVLPAEFVTTGEGTGIVHTAVMYGEDDFLLGKIENLPMVQLLNPNGTYNNDAPEFIRGKYIKDAEKDIKRDLESRGLLFEKKNNTHSYPHCYRCGTPLIYNAVSSWFIDIQKVKDRMLAENEKVNWVPEHLKHGRFKHIVESAPDWTISRNRFWASPLPIWKEKGGERVMVIGSLDELKKRVKKSGNRYFMMRHGEAEFNVTKTLNAKQEIKNGLTEKGKNQAKSAAATFSHVPLTKIYASPVQRAKETAEIVADACGLDRSKIIYDERLRELALGTFEGKSIDGLLAWRAGHSYDEAIPGGESYQDAKRRFGAFLYELDSKSEGTVLIVTHGIGIESLGVVARGSDKEESKKIIEAQSVPAGYITELAFAPLPVNAEYELDLHRPYTDSLILLDDEGREYERIPEVVDCWVESGSMPFAEYHYPFENTREFERRAPGDFIAEYIAQTRTWFYYMHAFGVLLFDRLAFKNVVTTGTILAADGSKMSKSKGNYTDPLINLDRFGADALRFYLMGSVVMQAEDFRFKDEDLRDAHNRVVQILWNTYKFYELYKNTYDGTTQGRKSTHLLDRWVFARLDEVTDNVTQALDVYDTPRACRTIKDFVDDYSTWYVRRSRDRTKSGDAHDIQMTLATQREVLLTFSRLIAPIMPFIAESIYRGVGGEKESVHLAEWPTNHKGFLSFLFPSRDAEVLSDMKRARTIVTTALMRRAEAGMKVRQPLQALRVNSTRLSKSLTYVIAEEVNVKEVVVDPSLPEQEVVLDTVLTDALREEGDLRELIRAIQDARKKAGLSQGETAAILVTGGEREKNLVEKFQEELRSQTHSHAIAFETGENSILVRH